LHAITQGHKIIVEIKWLQIAVNCEIDLLIECLEWNSGAVNVSKLQIDTSIFKLRMLPDRSCRSGYYPYPYLDNRLVHQRDPHLTAHINTNWKWGGLDNALERSSLSSSIVASSVPTDMSMEILGAPMILPYLSMMGDMVTYMFTSYPFFF
jgi:hypothetical protein